MLTCFCSFTKAEAYVVNWRIFAQSGVFLAKVQTLGFLFFVAKNYQTWKMTKGRLLELKAQWHLTTTFTHFHLQVGNEYQGFLPFQDKSLKMVSLIYKTTSFCTRAARKYIPASS